MTLIDFALPPELEADAPPDRRDAVRLLVARGSTITHAAFADFADYLEPGDLVVVNTSATLAAAVEGRRADGQPVVVHFSTEQTGNVWLVEIRPPAPAHGPAPGLERGERIRLRGGGELTLRAHQPAGQTRLWRADVQVDGGVVAYLQRFGAPIRYSYVTDAHPLQDYQTVFATDLGSAEMPSAGRPFTQQIVTDLVVRGVGVAPVTLHTGVSSQEDHEPPLAERFAVPATTAHAVNSVRARGGRIVAVGTTVTRALESVADVDGTVRAGEGWTELVLSPERPARVVGGLVTGWHAPGASHLLLLQAVAGSELVQRAYDEAVCERYRWHEFGDSALLLPELRA